MIPQTTMMQAPAQTMQSMVVAGYAPPMTTQSPSYVAANTSMYMPAAAGSMYMPAMEAAQVMAVAAPQQVAYAPPAPVVEVVPEGVNPLQQAGSFINLTGGMPDPDRLKKESDAYGRALEGQLKKQSEAVIEEAKLKKQMLDEQAKRDVAQYQLQLEENLRMQMMQVDKEAQLQLMGLQEAAINRKTLNEEESAIKSANYAKAKAMEEMANKAKDVRKQFNAAEAKLTAEYQAVMKAGSRAVVTPQVPMVPGVTMPEYAAPAQVAYAAPAQVAYGYGAAPQQVIYG